MVPSRFTVVCVGLLAALASSGMSRPRVVDPGDHPSLTFSTLTDEQRVEAMLSAVVEGDFDGKLRVDIYKNAPAAGVYRGMAMVKPTGVADFMPLAWIVVVAT